MKSKSILCAAVLGTAVSLAPWNQVRAGEGHDHGHSHGADHGSGTIQVPESLPELWAAIRDQNEALQKAVDSQHAGQAHEAEQKLQVYLGALPQSASGLSESTLKRVKGQAKNLSRVFAEVHHDADDGNWKKAGAEMKKASGGLKLLEAQLPKP